MAGYYFVNNKSSMFQAQSENVHEVSIAELNSTYSDSLAKINKTPWVIPELKDSLRPLAERLTVDSKIQKDSPKIVANIYRLYSASFLMAFNGDIGKIREGVLWSRRAVELYSNWSDRDEFTESISFFQSMLDGNSASGVDVKKLLYHVLRIGMIESPSRQVADATDQAYELIVEMKDASQNKQLDTK